MEPIENEAVIAFDTLYTNNHIQILKVLLPYFDVKGRKQLAVLIKFMELRYTMDYFNRHSALNAATQEEYRKSGQPDIVKIFEQIKNFCTPSERAMFDQLANMKKSMEMYEEMMSMMQMFSQLMPEGESKANDDIPCGARTEYADFPEHDCSDQNDSTGQSSNPFGNANPMDMLKGMLSPEQQAMFEMFQSSFGNTNERSG